MTYRTFPEPDDIRVVPRVCLDGNPSWRRTTRLVEMGDHIDTEYGWGLVLKIDERRGSMYIRVSKLGPDLGRQEFPEYEVNNRPPPHGGEFARENYRTYFKRRHGIPA